MKVIKKGKKIPNTMRVTCEKCEAELEISASDLKEEPRDRYWDPRIYSYRCPECGRFNNLKYDDLPEEIRFDLDIF